MKYTFGPFFANWFYEGPPRFPYSDAVLTLGISTSGYTFSLSYNIVLPVSK